MFDREIDELYISGLRQCYAQIGEMLEEYTEKIYNHELSIDNRVIYKLSQKFIEIRKLFVSDANTKGVEKHIENRSLERDFAHCKPYAFCLDTTTVFVKKWKDFLIEAVTLFYDIDKGKMNKIILENKKLCGRYTPYISEEPILIRSPRYIEKYNVYVETNLSANQIVGIVKEIAIEFDKYNSFVVYVDKSEFDFDRRELNNTNVVITDNENFPTDDPTKMMSIVVDEANKNGGVISYQKVMNIVGYKCDMEYLDRLITLLEKNNITVE